MWRLLTCSLWTLFRLAMVVSWPLSATQHVDLTNLLLLVIGWIVWTCLAFHVFGHMLLAQCIVETMPEGKEREFAEWFLDANDS